jgi:hypothetical protein
LISTPAVRVIVAVAEVIPTAAGEVIVIPPIAESE